MPATRRDVGRRAGADPVSAWFGEPKLGLFLHWGLYALNGWHEQDQWRRKWPREAYAKLARRFTAKNFNPDHWLDVADELGASYVCLTAKHADGFCLWDSALTEYTSTNTPFGRDVVGELAAACRRRRMPLFLYYSVVDEHHPAYPHAGRRWEYPAPLPGDRPSKAAYLRYLKGQVEELCTKYGRLHGFWWDANIAGWRDPSMNAMIRRLQPGIVINNRGLDPGDYGTPERDWDASVDTDPAFAKPIEACQALGSQSWGYRQGEDYYTETHLLRSIAKVLGKGGNYLLNTGPRPDGTIAPRDRRMLRRIGDWFRATREAFVGVERVPGVLASRDLLLARKDARTYYAILCQVPATRSPQLKPFVSLPAKVTELATGGTVECRNDLLPWDHEHGVGYLRLYDVPERILLGTAPVFKLEFGKPPKTVIPTRPGGEVEP